jgi:hypothetical protein
MGTGSGYKKLPLPSIKKRQKKLLFLYGRYPHLLALKTLNQK